MSGRGHVSEREKELRQFTCEQCGAEPGKTCRTIVSNHGYYRHGSPSSSHSSRVKQLRRKKEGGYWKMVWIPDNAEGQAFREAYANLFGGDPADVTEDERDTIIERFWRSRSGDQSDGFRADND